MPAPSNRARIAAAIDILSGALGPWIAKTLAPRLPAGASWTRLLAAKDARPDRQYRADDLQCQLRILTERIGELGFPFSGVLSRGEQNLAGELRDVRNAWAHNAPFNADDTYRALDTAERLLRAIGAPESAGRVRRLRVDAQRSTYEAATRRDTRAAAVAMPGLGRRASPPGATSCAPTATSCPGTSGRPNSPPTSTRSPGARAPRSTSTPSASTSAPTSPRDSGPCWP